MITLMHKSSHIGVGLYSLAEAARIIKTPPSRVRQWASVRNGLVPRALAPEEKTITFIELMELHFIKLFRDEGVALQTIRRASRAAAARFQTAYPFSVKRFDTDGRTIFATLKARTKSKTLVEDLAKSQYVFDTVVRPFFHKLEYSQTTELVRFWPRSKKGRVVLDPARKFGKPIDAVSGIPTRVIFDALSAGGGQSPAVVARWLGVPLATIKAAADFESSLVK